MILTAPDKFKNVRERLDWHFGFFAMEDRFVHSFLMIMRKRESKRVKTMSVHIEGSSIILEYNIEFVNSLKDPELRFVIKHEIYHIVFHHCTHRCSEDPTEQELDNIAADLAINCLIPQTSSTQAPEGVTMPTKFGFENKLSREQYLDLLREQRNQNKNKGNQNGDGEGDGEGDGSSGDENGDSNEESGSSAPGGYGDGEGGSIDHHGSWNESSIADEIIRNKITQISRTANAWGNMPGDLQAMILAAQKSQVPWSKYLKHYIGQLITSQSEQTFKRPNRRFGYPYSGRKRMHSDKKLVAIDTSGSISDDDLRQFLAEINKLQEYHPVDLILFDTQIQYGPKEYARRNVSFDFKGRGGTYFKPVFDVAEQRRYTSVIVLTDGYADSPEKPACVKDVLWVITENGKKPVEWGKMVKIDPAKK